MVMTNEITKTKMMGMIRVAKMITMMAMIRVTKMITMMVMLITLSLQHLGER